jgi:hypothetical protein
MQFHLEAVRQLRLRAAVREAGYTSSGCVPGFASPIAVTFFGLMPMDVIITSWRITAGLPRSLACCDEGGQGEMANLLGTRDRS